MVLKYLVALVKLNIDGINQVCEQDLYSVLNWSARIDFDEQLNKAKSLEGLAKVLHGQTGQKSLDQAKKYYFFNLLCPFRTGLGNLVGKSQNTIEIRGMSLKKHKDSLEAVRFSPNYSFYLIKYFSSMLTLIMNEMTNLVTSAKEVGREPHYTIITPKLQDNAYHITQHFIEDVFKETSQSHRSVG
jgi:hypothetical protein